MIKIADRLKNVVVSETGEIQKAVLGLETSGKKIIKFHLGEPDFPTPKNIINAAKIALDTGQTKYGDGKGLEELRIAIAEKFSQEHGLIFDPEKEIIVTAGAKQALFETISSILNPGDGVIILIPAWVSYKAQVTINGGTPLFFDTTPYSFHLTGAALAKLDNFISCSRFPVKAIIINSPNNPTGAVYNQTELKELSQIIEKHRLAVISDEIYEKIVYDEISYRSIASVAPEISDNVITISGFSKTYAMTGLRIGYVAAKQNVISAIAKIHSANQTHPSIPEQWAALEALTGPQDFVEKSRKTFEQRRNCLAKWLKEIGIKFVMPQGAFYIFADINEYLGKELNGKAINSSSDFAESLLNEELVAVVAGSAFGVEGWIRISFATSQDDIKEGMKRIEKFLTE